MTKRRDFIMHEAGLFENVDKLIVDKDTIKVLIQLTNWKTIDAYVFIDHGARLQELINDERNYIPFHILDPERVEYDCVHINKQHILSITEWREDQHNHMQI